MEIGNNMSDEEILQYLKELDDEQTEVDKLFDEDDEDDIAANEAHLKEQSKLPLHKRKPFKPKKAVDRKSEIFKIKNEYINNNRTHDLFVTVDKQLLTSIIEIETAEIARKMETVKVRVHTKIEQCLMKHIPQDLKSVYNKYPQAFIVHPGFEYKAAEANGGGKMWINPKVPMFFDQFTEYGLLLKYFSHIMPLIDSNVSKYHHYVALLLKQEAKLATQLSKVEKLVDLLETNVKHYRTYISMQEERKKAIAIGAAEKSETKTYIQRYGK